MHEEEAWPFVRVRCLASCAGPAESLWWYPEVEAPSLVAQMVKNLPAMWETWVWSLGREDPLEKEMATHSSTLAWRIPWTEAPGGYSPWSHKESDTAKHAQHRMSIKPFFAYSVTARSVPVLQMSACRREARGLFQTVMFASFSLLFLQLVCLKRFFLKILWAFSFSSTSSSPTFGAFMRGLHPFVSNLVLSSRDWFESSPVGPLIRNHKEHLWHSSHPGLFH